MYGGTARSSASCLRNARSFSNSASSQAISPGAMLRRLGRRDGFGERDFLARLERRAAGVRQLDDVEFLRVLEQQAEPHQFAADRRPFGARVFLADAVGRKRVMAQLADFLRVRAAEHLDDVLDADAKSAFLADAIDAGEKFLRGQRAIPGRRAAPGSCRSRRNFVR